MPTFTFSCKKCNFRFEKSVKSDQKHTVTCTSCNELVENLPPTGVGFKMAESKHIPKDIDRAVGKDAEKKWMEYEDKKKLKDKIRQESGSDRLSVFDGQYSPFSMTVDGKEVKGEEGTKYRKEMLNDYLKIKNDPTTEKKEASRDDMVLKEK